MNETQIKKIQEGKAKVHKYRKELNGIICRFKDGKNEYVVSSTAYQYSLVINNSETLTTYHPSIESVLDELLTIKQKSLMVKSKTKDLLSVRQSILDGKEWMKKIVHPLIDSTRN